jgi:hypothetical protein
MKIVEISCLILIETDKAYKIDHGGKEPCWVPKSQVEFYPTDNTMQMPEWLAIEKDIL